MKASMSTIFIHKKGLSSLLFLPFLLTVLFFTVALNGQRNDRQFVVVLDAGHGGHDPGNLGMYACISRLL